MIDNELGKNDRIRWLLRRPNFIMANRKNRNNVRRTIAVAGRWSLVQDLVAGGAGLDCWCKTDSRWIGGHLEMGFVCLVGLVWFMSYRLTTINLYCRWPKVKTTRELSKNKWHKIKRQMSQKEIFPVVESFLFISLYIYIYIYIYIYNSNPGYATWVGLCITRSLTVN